MKTKSVLLIALLAMPMLTLSQTVTKDFSSAISGTVCPSLPTSYSLTNVPSSFSGCTRKWVPTNGTVIGSDAGTSVSIQWSDTPGAKAKLVCQFSNCGNSNSGTETAPLEELILSVKDQAWGSYGTVVNVDYCTKSQVNLTVPRMYVQGTGGINQPSQREVVYSWTLPGGWREVGTGRTGNFGTFINAIAIEPVVCSVPGSVSVKGIINVPPIACGSAGASATATISLNSVSPLATITVPQGYGGSTACNTTPVTFSALISPSLGCVSSYNWSYPPSWSLVSQSANNITLRPSGIPADAGLIRGTVNFSCGSSTTGSTLVRYVEPVITTNAIYVCTSNQFSLSNAPGVTASWSSSNTGIATVNSLGIVSRVPGSISGYVTISATPPCAATVVPKRIWVGPMLGIDNVENSIPGFFSTSEYYKFSTYPPGIFSGQWSVSGGYIVENGGDYVLVQFTVNNEYASITFQPNNDSCGSGTPSMSIFIGQGGCPSGDICPNSVYPNPADDQLNVSLTGSPNETSEVQVELYNSQSTLVQKNSSTGKDFQFSVKNLSNGIYYLRLKRGKKMLHKRIEIKH
jgi:hypothetical protein